VTAALELDRRLVEDVASEWYPHSWGEPQISVTSRMEVNLGVASC
jgi:hypothetical protein